MSAQFLYYCFLGAIVLGVARLLLLAAWRCGNRFAAREAPPPLSGRGRRWSAC